MALDLYQRLGLKRGASEAEIKKAYRSLAKQLHPDRNKDNPDAAKRFGEITHAYDLLSDKDKRARYDRGEIDEEGNPKMPFGSGFGGYSRRRWRSATGRTAGFREYAISAAPTRPISATCSRDCSGPPAARGARRGGGPFSGFRQRARAPQKGADVAYRLKIPFDRRGRAEAAADHAGRRQDDRPEAAPGPRGRHQDPLAGQGPGRARRPRRRHRHDRDRAAPILHPRGRRYPARAADHAQGSGAGCQGEGADARRTGDADHPQGHVRRARCCASRGAASPAKGGKRGDQLVTVEVDLPVERRELQRFAEEWDGGGNPRAGLGV